MERILCTIKPDTFKSIDDPHLLKMFFVDYSVLKITSRIAKLGKDLKFIYDGLDKDKSGSCKNFFLPYDSGTIRAFDGLEKSIFSVFIKRRKRCINQVFRLRWQWRY